jgi:hypothetical protein
MALLPWLFAGLVFQDAPPAAPGADAGAARRAAVALRQAAPAHRVLPGEPRIPLVADLDGDGFGDLPRSTSRPASSTSRAASAAGSSSGR